MKREAADPSRLPLQFAPEAKQALSLITTRLPRLHIFLARPDRFQRCSHKRLVTSWPVKWLLFPNKRTTETSREARPPSSMEAGAMAEDVSEEFLRRLGMGCGPQQLLEDVHTAVLELCVDGFDAFDRYYKAKCPEEVHPTLAEVSERCFRQCEEEIDAQMANLKTLATASTFKVPEGVPQLHAELMARMSEADPAVAATAEAQRAARELTTAKQKVAETRQRVDALEQQLQMQRAALAKRRELVEAAERMTAESNKVDIRDLLPLREQLAAMLQRAQETGFPSEVAKKAVDQSPAPGVEAEARAAAMGLSLRSNKSVD